MTPEKFHQTLVVVIPRCLLFNHMSFLRIIHDLKILAQVNQFLRNPHSILKMYIIINNAVNDQQGILNACRVVDRTGYLVSFRILIREIKNTARP
jgi:hypothetical protein